MSKPRISILKAFSSNAIGLSFLLFGILLTITLFVWYEMDRNDQVLYSSNLAKISTHLLVLGLILDFLLAFVFFTALSARSRALHLVAVKTKQVVKRENFLKLILDSTAEAIYGIDLQGNCTFCNQACLDILGYATEKELLGKNMHLICHYKYPDGRHYPVENCNIYIAFKLEEKTHCDAEVFWRKDDSCFPAEYWSYLQYEEGVIVGAVVTFLDITERKKSEKAGQESENRFRTLANTAPVLIWIAGLDKLCFWFNQVWLDFTGRSMEQEMGNGWAEGVHPEDLQHCLDIYITSFDAQKKFSMEYRLRRADGEYRWLLDNGVPRFDDDGDFLGYIGSCTDITERKVAQEQSKELSARLTLATQAGGIGVWDYDIARNVLTWDKQMFELYGLSKEEFSGAYETWRSGLHPDDVERCNSEFQMAAAGTKDYNTEFRIIWPEGSVHYIRALAIVQRDETGKALSMIGTNWDITKQKEIEESLQRSISIKREFLANMSHEIRTPMNGVIGMTHLLLGTPLDKDQRRYLEIIHSSGESLLELINDILDFSKLEAHKVNLESISFDLQALLDSLLPPFVTRSQEKGLEFISSMAPEVSTLLQGDPYRLRQILNNFISNAIKFTSQGKIVIRMSSQEETVTDTLLRFSVKDTGIGISAGQMGLLFEKFSQADASTTRKFGGSGLGLAISKQLVEMMGGRVGVESSLGQGSEFWFTLRFLKQKSVPAHPNVVVPLAGHETTSLLITKHKAREMLKNSARILLVEDNETNQQVALGILKYFGLKADVANNGLEAIKDLTARDYDLVLMDVQMPELDGYEATRIIRDPQSTVRNHQVPIIAMTANAMESDRQKCLDIGMNDYLTKPVEIERFKKCLRKWISMTLRKESKSFETLSQAPVTIDQDIMTESNIFDSQALLLRVQGDQQIAHRIVDIFLRDAAARIKEILVHLNSGDANRLEITVHSFKGAAGNVSAKCLQKLTEKMEKLAHVGDLSGVANLMTDLQTEQNRLQELIVNWRKNE